MGSDIRRTTTGSGSGHAHPFCFKTVGPPPSGGEVGQIPWSSNKYVRPPRKKGGDYINNILYKYKGTP